MRRSKQLTEAKIKDKQGVVALVAVFWLKANGLGRRGNPLFNCTRIQLVINNTS